MAGDGDIVAVCLLTTVSVREPHSHVHVLREWDET